MTKIRISILIFFFLTARMASAQVFVSEIMYDPKGGDTGHEWVEIVNQGVGPVDLAHAKLVEGGSSHGLTVIQGGANLSVGAYAIIADNARNFLNDHLNFPGIVIDSAFSLKNTGETISLKLPNGTISDTVIYTSEMGGAGDGNTLQKNGTTWKGSVPTPGESNILTALSLVNEVTPPSHVVNSSNISSFPVEPQIIADAGPKSRSISTGAPIVFSGHVFGLKKEPIDNARLVWTFGDGSREEGVSVSHTYYYPGEYIVVLDAASGYFSASDRVTVRVSVPVVSIHTGGDKARSFTAIENRGADEIDLSLWQVMVGNSIFIFPKNTVLGSQKVLTLASEVSGLTTPAGSTVSLNFPNGSHVETQAETQTVVTQVPAVTYPVIALSKSTTRKDEAGARPPQRAVSNTRNQEASVISAIATPSQPLLQKEEEALWLWYIGAAFLVVFALFGLRLARKEKEDGQISAEDFEIIEDEEPH